MKQPLKNVEQIIVEGKGLNDEGSTTAMATMRQGVEEFGCSSDEKFELVTVRLSNKMVAQIDKYDDKLFAPSFLYGHQLGRP